MLPGFAGPAGIFPFLPPGRDVLSECALSVSPRRDAVLGGKVLERF